MRRNWLGVCGVLGLAALACGAAGEPVASSKPQIALIYSDYQNAKYAGEFDRAIALRGWSAKKFKNTDVASLVTQLNEFDVVISTTLGNFDRPQELGQWKTQWLGFLERGGVLLVVDANYESVLNRWINQFGPDFELAADVCRPLTVDKRDGWNILANPDYPLLSAPHDIRSSLLNQNKSWGHFTSWKSGWANLMTCRDDKSLFLCRQVGKGVLAVTTCFEHNGIGPGAAEISGKLLDNLWVYGLGCRSGLMLAEFKLGPAVPGSHRACLGLRNLRPAAPVAAGRVVVERSMDQGPWKEIGQAAMAELAPGQTSAIAVPYEVTERGGLALRVSVISQDRRLWGFDCHQTIPPLVKLELGKAHLYPEDPTVRFSAEFAFGLDPAGAKYDVRACIDGIDYWRQPCESGAQDYALDVPALAVGKHTLGLTVFKNGKSVGQAETEFFFHPMPAVYSGRDGVTRVHGKPFFPFGFYHVSWFFTSEERLACLRDLAAAGFNTMHAGINEMNEWKPFLDEAQKRNVYVITEFGGGLDPAQVIGRYKNHPALLAWNPGDEPDGGTNELPPSEMSRRHNVFKREDPEHPTYLTLCNPRTFNFYANCADIVNTDPYPVPVNASDQLSLVYTNMVKLRSYIQGNRVGFWGVVQCFGYPEKSQDRWSQVPTFSEVRNMTYQALLAGVKGILYYTYADDPFKVKKHPELWAGLKTLPAELTALQPFLLEGKLTVVPTGQPDVLAGVWTVGGRTVVCVISTSYTDAHKVAIALPALATAGGQAAPLFRGRPQGMAYTNGRLEGTVKPLEVHLYEISTTGTGTSGMAAGTRAL